MIAPSSPEGTGLIDRAVGPFEPTAAPDEARRRWEAALTAEIERLRQSIRQRHPESVAHGVGGTWRGGVLEISYWGISATVPWEDLTPCSTDGDPLPAFDQAMLLHHLRTSDGAPLAGRWIGFRELPGGEFYHQAYQGYTGRRLAAAFGADPDSFNWAASTGERLGGPAPHSFGFYPLPRIALAACLWPGDDELPPQASVLFDANASRHLPIDGLALLGAGLTGRLLKAAETAGQLNAERPWNTT